MYEINTWIWLQELSIKHGRPVTLSNVPGDEWDYLASLGMDAIWFMGVWERSPLGIQIALNNKEMMTGFNKVLPDFRNEDVVGSPYCIRNYRVDDHLGGPEGLIVARKMLYERGMRLILDFVPNHTAPDHPWVYRHPEYYILGNTLDLEKEPGSFLQIDGNIIACGRDPYFPPWPDVLQVNAFHQGLRNASLTTVNEIAAQCDGIRCDMAMLMINTIFRNTWGDRAGEMPKEDYWRWLIPAVKRNYPEFLFIAEAYWDLEWELMQQGFDYCYDKRLYDRIEHDTPENIRLHLSADTSYQDKLVRFIENHDEKRAATVFSKEKGKAAAAMILTLPGAKLIHEGQFKGLKIRLPVFLGKRPHEKTDPDLEAFYFRLMKEINQDIILKGQWRLCDRIGLPGDNSHLNILAWCWTLNESRCLFILNYSGSDAQARIQIPWEDMDKRNWRCIDSMTGESFERNGKELLKDGYNVSLRPWEFHLYNFHQL